MKLARLACACLRSRSSFNSDSREKFVNAQVLHVARDVDVLIRAPIETIGKRVHGPRFACCGFVEQFLGARSHALAIVLRNRSAQRLIEQAFFFRSAAEFVSLLECHVRIALSFCFFSRLALDCVGDCDGLLARFACGEFAFDVGGSRALRGRVDERHVGEYAITFSRLQTSRIGVGWSGNSMEW